MILRLWDQIARYNEDMHNSAYIKTWVGALVPQNNYEAAYQPRGGGWGIVRNVTFSNFDIYGADSGPSITQDNGNNGSYAGTSKMQITNILFQNFTGYLNGESRTSSVSCSRVQPCRGIEFREVKLKPSIEDDGFGKGSCSNVRPGAVRGVSGPGCSKP